MPQGYANSSGLGRTRSAERVLGRKKHYGSRSLRGTEVAALLYSLTESEELAGVGPHTHLRAATNAALRDGSVLLSHELV